ncbi:MAG TPA: SBBP repeat-containing protein [Verrucomicrobiae bacterium]|nr:SBBP repeat-containing protein [Verrucomicrobiae bacterium]
MRRFAKKISVALFFGILAFPLSAFCQVDTAWVRRYNGPAGKEEQAKGLVVDDSGNIYVTGFSFGLGNNSDLDFATIKYDRHGNEVWIRRHSSSINSGTDSPEALVLDKRGNVYVTGISYNDYFTIKYDSQGSQLWTARYNGPGNGEDWATDVCVDEEGFVYVTGLSVGAGTDRDYATVKYDSNGNQLWVVRYDNPQHNGDHGHLIAVDKNGNAYVSGHTNWTNLSGGVQWVTIKYDSMGNELWLRDTIRWQTSYSNGPTDLKLDSQGNVYVCGGMEDSVTKIDYTIIKYDGQGKLLWSARFNGPANDDDWAVAIDFDKEGNVLVTGFSRGIGTDGDITTFKYDSLGNELWVQHFNGPGNGYDAGYGLRVDSAGNVYVAGTSVGNGTNRDYILLKYDTNGNLLWEKRYNSSLNSVDEAWAISIDRSGNIVVTGRSIGSSTPYDYDFATIKYSPLPILKGDLNLDGVMTLADVVLMLNFTFNGTPFPAAPAAGDLNCNGTISPTDVVILLQIFFLSVSPPC